MNYIEDNFVHNVYDKICHEFDITRQYAWPPVAKFVKDIPSMSLVCDAGCGNGKNMLRDDLMYVGTDLSSGMCKLTQTNKKIDIIQSNILTLPFNDNTFDYVISMCSSSKYTQ